MFDFEENLFLRIEIAEQLLGSKKHEFCEELHLTGEELADYIETLNSQLDS